MRHPSLPNLARLAGLALTLCLCLLAAGCSLFRPAPPSTQPATRPASDVRAMELRVEAVRAVVNTLKATGKLDPEKFQEANKYVAAASAALAEARAAQDAGLPLDELVALKAFNRAMEKLAEFEDQ